MSVTPVTVDDEFRKNSELKREDVDKLKDWIEKQPHLPNISDLEIIFFLHSCFYSIERAKHTIETYYTVRTHVPEFFSNRDPNHHAMVKAGNTLTFFTLPNTTPKGERVIYCKLYDTDPSHFVLSEVLKFFTFVTDLMLLEHGTDLGHRIVIDMDGVIMGHLARLGIMPIKKYLFYLQEAMPIRLSGLHFINAVPFMDKILALMRPFMKQELMNMLFINTAAEIKPFYEVVPRDIMPSEYNGKAPSVITLREKSNENIKANRKYFLEEEKLRVNETLRPGKAKNAGDLFGIEGSFKKLDID